MGFQKSLPRFSGRFHLHRTSSIQSVKVSNQATQAGIAVLGSEREITADRAKAVAQIRVLITNSNMTIQCES